MGWWEPRQSTKSDSKQRAAEYENLQSVQDLNIRRRMWLGHDPPDRVKPQGVLEQTVRSLEKTQGA